VVKADGYGHGALPVARAALEAGADRLAVATLDEAISLREAGIAAPLHVFSETPSVSAGLLVEHRIIATVCTLPFAAALSAAAAAAGAVAQYHFKVDTGMNRIGVRAEDAGEFAASIGELPGLSMEGTFTHFATADVPGDWDFDQQLRRFRKSLDAMRAARVDPGIVHAANSAGTILHPEAHFDMVRCGVAIYGLHPAPATRGEIDLAPAMSVKAKVSFLKRIGMGEGVSYGFTFRAGSPTIVATLPLGYADGIHRAVSDAMTVLVGGTVCRQIGRICMDQLMVEIPSGLDVRVGDEAVIVGDQGGRRIVMDELADLAGTINYEQACSLGLRLGRRYL
jgi:alanine racemase